MASHIKKLYNKYNVSRVDGRDQPGGDKENARYFVLDLVNDPYAISAMICYAKNARFSHPELAKELFELLEELDGQD